MRFLILSFLTCGYFFAAPCTYALSPNYDEGDFDPLVTIIFPLDNLTDTTMGHRAIKYVLYTGGYCTNTKETFGGTPKQDGPSNSAWLSRSHIDAVLKLVSQISASKALPTVPTKSIVMVGAGTKGKVTKRDLGQNMTAIRQMLRLLGGVRGDLEDHFATPTKVTSLNAQADRPSCDL